MAKYQLDPSTGVETISGAISRHRLPDGSVQACVFTKKGGMFFRTYKRSTPLSAKEIASRHLFAIAATVTKRRIEAGDTRRRQLIFKEVYASLKAQLSHRERNGSGTGAEREQVLTK